MKAVMNTKSNYKNCNGVQLEVVECKGTRISCYVPYDGFDKEGKPNSTKLVIADFSLKEVVELYS